MLQQRILDRKPVYRVFSYVVSLLLVLSLSHLVCAQPNPANRTRQVLVLNSYTPTYAWTENIVKGVQSVFDPMGNIELSVDNMDTKKVNSPEYFQLLADVYTKKYSKLKFDLIISSDDDALNFLLKYRDTVFPNVPVVFCGVNNYRDGRLNGQKGFTGVNEENDYDRTFEWIAKNRPQAKNIVVVVDETTTSASHITRINASRKNWEGKFNIRFTEKVTIGELRDQLRALKSDSVVFWAMFMRDRAGVPLSFRQSVQMVVENANVPVFGAMDITVSQGAMGGYVASGTAQGQVAARLGQRILAGEAVDSVPVVKQSPNVFMFDYPSLQHWKMPDSAIPPNAEVLNRPVSFYQQYKRYVWAALGGMGAETAVIFVLLGMIRTITRKNRLKLRESEERYRSIVEDGNELISRIGSDLRVQFANGAFGRFVGKKADELVDKPLCELLGMAPNVMAQVLKLSAANPVVPIEVECVRGDGERRWVEWNCRGFFSEDGKLSTVQAVGHDTTERRKAEAAVLLANMNLQGVLDGMQEALFVCDTNGRLGTIHSRATTEWFGEPKAGADVVDYLFDVDGRAKAIFRVAVSQLCEDILPFDVNVAQLPKLLHRREQVYRIECHQVVRNGGFDGLIFVLANVTAVVHQERIERLNRELPAVVGNLLRDREGFQSFVTDTNELLAKLGTTEDRVDLRRVLHTIKGNTAIYGFEYFSSRCHSLEDSMDADTHEPSESSIVTLSNEWRDALDSFAMFLNQEASEGVELDSQEYQELLQKLEQQQDHNALLRSVKRWAHPRLRQVLGIYGRTVKQLARRFNKEVDIDVEDHGLRLPRGEMRWFLSVLVHVVRNAVDHGIEAPEEREKAGKSRAGRVRIECAVDGSTFLIAVEDDGAGIQWNSVAKRAKTLGLPSETEADLQAAIFHDGLTTKDNVSDISGRGVGLGAVIDSCKQLGGTAKIKSDRGKGTRFEFRFVLPSLVPVPLRPLAAARPASTAVKREAG